MKNIFFYVTLFIFAPCSLVQADTIISLVPRVDISSNWSYILSNEPYNPDIDHPTDWKSVQLPLSFNKEMNKGNHFLWLQKKLVFSTSLGKKRIFLLLGRIAGVFDVYLNGVLIGMHGNLPPHIQYHSGTAKSFYLPDKLIHLGSENTLVVSLYHEAPVFAIPPVSIGDINAFYYDTYFVNFLNASIYQSLTILSMIICIFYFIQFIFRTKVKTNLYFSLVNLCFAIYFLNMGFEYKILPFPFAYFFSQSMMPLFFGLLVIFFVNHFSLHNNKWFKRVVMLTALIFFLLFYIYPKDTAECSALFTIALIPAILELFFMGYVVIRIFVQGKREVLPLLIGSLLGIGLGMHDMFYMLMDKEPFAWIQGIGIFCFNFSMFIFLSIQSVKTYKALEKYSSDVAEKSRALENYIQNLNEISVKISGISGRLEENIVHTSQSIQKMAAGSKNINTKVVEQYTIIETANREIQRQLESQELIYSGVQKQSLNVEQISPVIGDIIVNIRDIAGELLATSAFTKKLEANALDGEKAALSSYQSITEIKNVSENINEIIDTLTDLSERTNLLSINASIEAAHAGASGRGFKIISDEIKQLAGNAAQRSREIIEQVKIIYSKINEGVRTNNVVKEVLLKISTDVLEASRQVEAAYTVIEKQRISGEKVQSSLKGLHSSTTGIRKLVDTQGSGHKKVKDNLENMVATSREIIDNIKTIILEIERIQSNMETVKTVSANSNQIIGQLTHLLK